MAYDPFCLPNGKASHRTHAWKLHLNFDVDHHVPASWELTDARGKGASDEKNVLRRRLQADRTYVMDRYYAQFKLFNEIQAIGSSYVCRVRDNSNYQVVEDRKLSAQDIEAGVISDQIVTMGMSSKPGARPDHPIRLVCVKMTPHKKRGRVGGGTSGAPSDGVLRIATNLLDAPAHVIAFLYEYRWTLINILTGRKPNKWMVTLMSLYLNGWASDADVLRELNRPDNTGIKLRAKDELWKKLGVN